MQNISDGISSKVDNLEKLFNLNQQNINFNLILTWTVLGVMVAVIGIALYFLAKMWVDKAVKENLEKIKKDIINQIDQSKKITVVRNVTISGKIIATTRFDFKAGIIKIHFGLEENQIYVVGSFIYINDSCFIARNRDNHSFLIVEYSHNKKTVIEVTEVNNEFIEFELKSDEGVPSLNIVIDILLI